MYKHSRLETKPIPPLPPPHPLPLPLLTPKTTNTPPLPPLSTHKNNTPNNLSPLSPPHPHTPTPRIHSRPGTRLYNIYLSCAQRTKNPPSIPTLALVWLVGWLRGSKIIIDWHNLGYTILALKLGPEHLLVRIAKWSVLPSFPSYSQLFVNLQRGLSRFEATFGRSAYAHLFVTNAMHDHLVKEWDLQYVHTITTTLLSL